MAEEQGLKVERSTSKGSGAALPHTLCSVATTAAGSLAGPGQLDTTNSEFVCGHGCLLGWSMRAGGSAEWEEGSCTGLW